MSDGLSQIADGTYFGGCKQDDINSVCTRRHVRDMTDKELELEIKRRKCSKLRQKIAELEKQLFEEEEIGLMTLEEER